MSLLSVSIVNVVLPSIDQAFDASPAALQWVLAGYTLSFGIIMVPAGRAGDVYGRARLFVAGVAIFGLASLLAGFAPNTLVLNGARLLMGIGSGFLNPQTVGLIQQYFQGPARGRAFGMFGAVVGISVAVGPVLGGFFVAMFGLEWGWRAAFLVNVPIAIVAIYLAFRFFPKSAWLGVDYNNAVVVDDNGNSAPAQGAAGGEAGGTSAAKGKRVHPDLDPVGTAIFTLAIFALMFPFLQGGFSILMAILLPLSVVLFVIWVVWENRYEAKGRSPMVDMNLFATRSFANGALLVSLYFMGMTSVWVLVAIFLQEGHGWDALPAGMIGLPGAIGSVFSAPWAGKHVFRFGRPIVAWGIVVALTGILGTILVALLNQLTGLPVWVMIFPLTLVGMAGGLVISPNQALTLADVPLKYAGAAGGVLQTGQRVGTAVGIAGITAVFFGFMPLLGWDSGFMIAFGVIGAIITIALIVAIVDHFMSRAAAKRSQSA